MLLWVVLLQDEHHLPSFLVAARHVRSVFFKCFTCEKQKSFCLALTSVQGGAALSGDQESLPRTVGHFSSLQDGNTSCYLCVRANPTHRGLLFKAQISKFPWGLYQSRNCAHNPWLQFLLLVWGRPCHLAVVPPSQLGPRFSHKDEHTGLGEDLLVYLSGFCSEYKSNTSSRLVVKKN